jgi:5-methylcytosine-specific restriction endonuclease McrA
MRCVVSGAFEFRCRRVFHGSTTRPLAAWQAGAVFLTGRWTEGTGLANDVLVLNADYEPLNICNVRRAIVLVYKGKAEVLHAHSNHDDVPAVPEPGLLRTVRPSVVKLRSHVRRPYTEMRVSRRSVFARDNFTCQYCGTMGKDLTLDHVRPKRHGGEMSWENLVTCCRRCNSRKADKTLEASGMQLMRPPRRPRCTSAIGLAKLAGVARHGVWQHYIPSLADFGGPLP